MLEHNNLPLKAFVNSKDIHKYYIIFANINCVSLMSQHLLYDKIYKTRNNYSTIIRSGKQIETCHQFTNIFCNVNIYLSRNLSLFKHGIFPKWWPNYTFGLCHRRIHSNNITIEEMISTFGRVVVGDAYSFVLLSYAYCVVSHCLEICSLYRKT